MITHSAIFKDSEKKLPDLSNSEKVFDTGGQKSRIGGTGLLLFISVEEI
jgi:hypothetical protein